MSQTAEFENADGDGIGLLRINQIDHSQTSCGGLKGHTWARGPLVSHNCWYDKLSFLCSATSSENDRLRLMSAHRMSTFFRWLAVFVRPWFSLPKKSAGRSQFLPASSPVLNRRRVDAVKRNYEAAEFENAKGDGVGLLWINQMDHQNLLWWNGCHIWASGPSVSRAFFDTTISLLGVMRAILMKNDILFRHMQHLRRRSLAGDHWRL